jgi:uncharacterized protein YjiS (DUF1127 family)
MTSAPVPASGVGCTRATPAPNIAIGSAAWAAASIGRFLTVFETVRRWRHRARSRAVLATLDERALRDIGLAPADVPRECGKPFWML